MELRVEQPLYLLLFLPFLLYFAVTGFKSFRKWDKAGRTVFIMRSLAVLLLVAAAADPYMYRTLKEEQILFLIDRSASMEGTEEALLTMIQSASDQQKAHQYTGVYSFAGDFQSVQQPSQELNPLTAGMTIQADGQTNIAQALQLAAGAGSSDLPTRMVLLSDGNETEGDAREQLIRLNPERVTVDVLPVERASTDDVAIDEFITPAYAFLGEEQHFTVVISSEAETDAKLIIEQNDAEIGTYDISLSEGTNEFSYSFPASNEGLIKYSAQIERSEDAFLENNRMISTTDVSGTPQVLVVDETGDSPLMNWVDTERIGLTQVTPAELPSGLSSILQYDAVIFDNVAATDISMQQMNVIEQAVRSFGTGFMMIGGNKSFGLGGYFKTPIEEALPVEMEVKGKHELPSLGLMIVMDRSGSMSGMKMELAKEAAARSVELLRPDDTVGVIAFDDRPWEVVPPSKLSEQKEIVDKILSVTPGGGTEIYQPLAEAYSKLNELKLQRKHIILLTDGQSAMPANYEELIQTGLESNVTLSTVSIGQDADRTLLESLAESGSGRFYDVADATTIPAILSRETVMISRTYIIDKPFYPVLYDSFWSPLFAEGIPEMNAYIASTAKQTATVAAESPQGDPILSEWNYGLGRTIAYNSSTDAWSGGFLQWSRWPEFWNDTVSRLLPSFTEIPFSISQTAPGRFAIEDPSGASAIMDINASDETGEDIPVETELMGPGEASVSLAAEPGLVFLSVKNESGAVFTKGVTIPYGEEYRLNGTNEELLTTLAKQTGGQMLASLDEAYRDIEKDGGTRLPIIRELLLTAMLLFFFDITIRRFGLRILKWRQLKEKELPLEETGALDQLIKAKKKR